MSINEISINEMLQPLGLIVAFSRNRCIGVNNELPWLADGGDGYPEDMKRFRKITRKHIVIMGRKTYESIGRPLPKRRNIILTRDRSFDAEGCEVYHSLDQALEACKTGEYSDKIPIIIGGSEIYKLALPKCTRMWLTVIDKKYDGDAFFPHYLQDEWDIVERDKFSGFEFKTLERRNIYLDLT